jgi:hypothetical protein
MIAIGIDITTSRRGRKEKTGKKDREMANFPRRLGVHQLIDHKNKKERYAPLQSSYGNRRCPSPLSSQASQRATAQLSPRARQT